MYRAFFRSLSQRAKDLRTKQLLDKIIRVDHAGEYGAKRIYQGQLAVLGNTAVGPVIKVGMFKSIQLRDFSKFWSCRQTLL